MNITLATVDRILTDADVGETLVVKDVRAFHDRFGLPLGFEREPHLLATEELSFRLKFLREELEEIEHAASNGDLVKFADGLADLVYVAVGTALFAHIPFGAVWAEVQRANMAKMRAPSAEASTRGTALDVVKPPGWEPPDIDSVLRDFGWQGD